MMRDITPKARTEAIVTAVELLDARGTYRVGFRGGECLVSGETPPAIGDKVTVSITSPES